MNTISYTDYWRQIAVSHNKLLHDPASENGDAAIGKKHFARYSADEVITGLRTKLSFPALMIELYERTLKSEQPYAIGCNYSGAFSVYQSANPEDYNAVEAAYNETEQIMDDILSKVWADHYGPEADRCQTPFYLFDFDSINIVPVGPVFDQQFGWRAEFSFKFNHLKNIATAPAAGVFL